MNHLDDDARPICPTCNGTHYVATKRYSDGIPMVEQPCPDCNDAELRRLGRTPQADREYDDTTKCTGCGKIAALMQARGCTMTDPPDTCCAAGASIHQIRPAQ